MAEEATTRTVGVLHVTAGPLLLHAAESMRGPFRSRQATEFDRLVRVPDVRTKQPSRVAKRINDQALEWGAQIETGFQGPGPVDLNASVDREVARRA